MKRSLLPLLVLIVGLPQLTETVYTPSLPDIAHSLSVPDALVEYTLTIYLVGFAVGTLFPMPIYFLGIGALMWIVFSRWIVEKKS